MRIYTLFLKEKTKEITQEEFLKNLKDIKKTFHRYKNIYNLRYLFLRKGMKPHLDERMESEELKNLETRYKNVQFLNKWINELENLK